MVIETPEEGNVGNAGNKSNIILASEEVKIKPVGNDERVFCVTSVTFVSLLLEDYELKPLREKLVVQLILKENVGQTLEELSRLTKSKADNVKTELNRNKDIFIISDKKESHKLYSLGSEFYNQRVQEIQNKINLFVEKQERKEKQGELRTRVFRILKEDGIIRRDGERVLIDLKLISEFDVEVSLKLFDNPELVIENIKLCLSDFGLSGDFEFCNFSDFTKIPIQELRADRLEKLIIIEASVTGLSDIHPKVVNSKFECSNCGAILTILQTENKFKEPTRCSCGWKGAFRIISKEMVDSCRIILEDDKSIHVNNKKLNSFLSGKILDKDNVNNFSPSKKVEVVGILKEIPIIKFNSVSTSFEVALEIYGLNSLNAEIKVENLSEKEITNIKVVCDRIDKEGISFLTHSFAPEIYGHEYPKSALIINQAQPKNNPLKEIRDKSNILFLGDPGIAKSKMANFITKINPGAKSGSCTGSSTVGLTASLDKDEYGWIVKPGLAVQSQDTCILSELNLIPDEEKPKLQQALNDMKVEINKATIHQKLNVTCGFVFDANPISGRFSDSIPLSKQINLFPPIKDRIDLIFCLRDRPDSQTDENVAKSMLNREEKIERAEYSIDFLSKFFAYVRSLPEPMIELSLHGKLINVYVEKRKAGNLSARFFEAILRLSKGIARLRASSNVEEKDLIKALEIYEKANPGEWF